MENNDRNRIYLQSQQIKVYDMKSNRRTLDAFYESERITLMECLRQGPRSILDIGCLNGDTLHALKASSQVQVDCMGVDIDPDAIAIAQKQYPDSKFIVQDFLDETKPLSKAELVVSLNLFDQLEDWKTVLCRYCELSTRWVNFSSLLRLDGPTVCDPDASFLFYAGGERRILWAVHNIWELAAYCGTEHIPAVSIWVYAYDKFDDRFKNHGKAVYSCHPMSPESMLVGNIVIELDPARSMRVTKKRPDLKIVLNGKTICDSPWNKHA